jgi:hypothetical protein
LVLDAASLTAFGADSLLIGGIRIAGTQGTVVSVTTGNLTVDNAGAALAGPDVILVSKGGLSLLAGSQITAAAGATAETLYLGDASVAGSGDGALLRVSGDTAASVVRQGLGSSTLPHLDVQAGVVLSGPSLILDSSAQTTLASTAALDGQAISLSSSRISLQFDAPGALQPAPGLVLSTPLLEGFQATAQSLTLRSYSSLDVYGIGSLGTGGGTAPFSLANLSLSAAEIRGFNQAGGSVAFNASHVSLDNRSAVAGPGSVAPASGSFTVNAGTIGIGQGQVAFDQFASVDLHADGGILLQGEGGLAVAGALNLQAPVVTGATGSRHTLAASGALAVSAPATGSASVQGGLGSSLTLQGSSVAAGSRILLPSGTIELKATAGDVVVDGILDAGGTQKIFADAVRYTDGGKILLSSQGGSVVLNAGSSVSVAAQAGGGDGGTLQVSAAQGAFVHEGALAGSGGQGGGAGSFFLDSATLDLSGALGGNDLSPLAAQLAASGFTDTVNLRIRGGGVAGVNNDVFLPAGSVASARSFTLSSDRGSITIGGTIDVSGETGGAIALRANGSVVLAAGAVLDASGQTFSNAGKGGSVSLEAGSQTNGAFSTAALGTGPQVDIQAGSAIDLSVAANTDAAATAANRALGKFGGTLHLRAPQTTGNTEVQIRAIDGAVIGASSIVAEGYRVYTPAGGAINTVTAAVQANGNTFAGNTAAIRGRLLANNASLAPFTVITPGAEIINTSGNLTLASDWNLGAFRFGPNGAAGVLTLRAQGDLIFTGSLSDGFSSAAFNATLLAQNAALPINAQSWSYRLSAGSDFTAVDFHRVQASSAVYDPTTGLAAGSAAGSLQLGNYVAGNNGNPIGTTTAAALAGRYQVIRTGTGDIDIAVAGDVLLRNQFATIYTAGVTVSDVTLGGLFDVPVLRAASTGTATQIEAARYRQFNIAGGNVTVAAQGNIAHVTRNSSGQIVPDSEKQLPTNWLYRRGYAATQGAQAGEFGIGRWGDVESTSWWIDYSNFFEGVGALGGGDVTLAAGHDISNVDAVIPTNARTTKQTSAGDKAIGHQATIELGGGDLLITAGNDINGGAYYVERGEGELRAGAEIRTNSTRSVLLGTNISSPQATDPLTWLPTTLFLGKGSIKVSARGDVLLGPTANPFLLPQGTGNTYWYKTYFSTYAPDSSVAVSSLAGDVTLRQGATLETFDRAQPLLHNWFSNVNLFDTISQNTYAYYQPWLRLAETEVGDAFLAGTSLLPGTLKASSFSGDINLAGSLTLSPSPSGTVELLAAGSVNGLQPTGVSNFLVANTSSVAWTASVLNLSDADPAAIPGVLNPYAYQTLVGLVNSAALTSTRLDLSFINALFAESGSTIGEFGTLQTKLQLHANINGGPLHAGDSDPLRIYADSGDVSGLTLFSGKSARVIAGQDVTDIAFYLQNTALDDISLVAAGRDIIAYNPTSALRSAALAAGNSPDVGSPTLAGDIQINGPGTLEVLAGENLDLGVGPNNTDRTALGITSIGNSRNPSLGFEGADIVAAAGLGAAPHAWDVSGFIAFLQSEEGSPYLAELGFSPEAFAALPLEQQRLAALQAFYAVLRQAGRDHNDPSSPSFGNYDAGFAAVAALFAANQGTGDISLTSREIKTQNGGDISLFAPGGLLTVGFDAGGNQPLDQGILTEAGGDISIYTQGSVVVGTSRIFTLRGGDIVIWSSEGDIAAGASSKTVQSAPPTRVIIDPQSADVATDLAGLATGGGIGVLNTVAGVEPGNVDLIAPSGVVDAGDAGIRVSGNLNIAAVQVLNASNIQTGGTNVGGTVPTVAAPNVSGLTAGANPSGAAANSAKELAERQAHGQEAQQEVLPSIITVEVLGYGGGEEDEDDDKEKARESAEGPQSSSENPL